MEVAHEALELRHPEVCVAVQLAEEHAVLHGICGAPRDTAVG